MTTIIYTNTNKVIEIRHIDNIDLQIVLKNFNDFEIVENYKDIRKIDKRIDTPQYMESLTKWY